MVSLQEIEISHYLLWTAKTSWTPLTAEINDFQHCMVIGSQLSIKLVREISTLLKIAQSTVGDVIVK